MVYYNNAKVRALVLIKQIIPSMLYYFNIDGIYYCPWLGWYPYKNSADLRTTTASSLVLKYPRLVFLRSMYICAIHLLSLVMYDTPT